jgi:TPR repeat protein
MDDNDSFLRAAQLIDSGDCAQAYQLLKPHIDEDQPEALFLFSKFSIKSETDEEFERRSVECLERAAAGHYPPALYALGVCYDSGELTAYDPLLAARLFEQAANSGYAKAKLSHGLNLYYGSNGIMKNAAAGLELIRAAADEGVEGAIEFLRG